MQINLRKVSKNFGPTTVLAGIDLEIRAHELFFLLGPSGCGKTTLLRLLAGFHPPDGGEIAFNGQIINTVPAHQRNVGMVFQNYALWPHLNVEQNVAYGLDVRGVPTPDKRQRVQAALESVRMAEYARRTPNQLSGGQQQRVALARALVVRPDVLLLDEPLSNLDARLRLEMRDEIRRLHAETRITTVYVTHDQKESLSLADRIAVLQQGRVEQLGSPREIYRQPANRFVADFIGETNWWEGVVETTGPQTTVRCGLGLVTVQAPATPSAGQKVWVGFRPESVRWEPAAVNHWSAEVGRTSYLGEVEEYQLQGPGGTTLKAFETNPDQHRPSGTRVEFSVRPVDCLLLPHSPIGS